MSVLPGVKDCARCGPRPESEFHKHAHHPDGLASVCKDCRRLYKQAYRAANKMRLAAEDQDYRANLLVQLLMHYGTSCACCGTTENLSIDHVRGGGGKHREELWGPDPGSGYRFWLWLTREGFPPGFQVLCVPCNSSKWTGTHCRMHAARACETAAAGA